MISMNYVNGNPSSIPIGDAYFSFLNEVRAIEESVIDDITAYNRKCEVLLTESMIMENGSYDTFVESEGPNIVEKIGKAVREMVMKTIEFIKSIVEAIRNIGFKNKSDMAKVESLVKKHPDLKDTIICSFQKGELEVKDVKTFAELERSYEEIVRLAQKNENPKSLKAKWDNAVEKFKNADKSAIASTAKAITAVITAAAAIVTIRKYSTEVNKAAKDIQDIHMKGTKMAMDALGSDAIKDMGNRELILTATRFFNDESSKCENKYKTFMVKIEDSIAKFIDRVDPESGKKAGGLIHDAKKFAAEELSKELEKDQLKKLTNDAKTAINGANKAAMKATNAANKSRRATQSLGHTVAKAKAMASKP